MEAEEARGAERTPVEGEEWPGVECSDYQTDHSEEQENLNYHYYRVKFNRIA